MNESKSYFIASTLLLGDLMSFSVIFFISLTKYGGPPFSYLSHNA